MYLRTSEIEKEYEEVKLFLFLLSLRAGRKIEKLFFIHSIGNEKNAPGRVPNAVQLSGRENL